MNTIASRARPEATRIFRVRYVMARSWLLLLQSALLGEGDHFHPKAREPWGAVDVVRDVLDEVHPQGLLVRIPVRIRYRHVDDDGGPPDDVVAALRRRL